MQPCKIMSRAYWIFSEIRQYTIWIFYEHNRTFEYVLKSWQVAVIVLPCWSDIQDHNAMSEFFLIVSNIVIVIAGCIQKLPSISQRCSSSTWTMPSLWRVTEDKSRPEYDSIITLWRIATKSARCLSSYTVRQNLAYYDYTYIQDIYL